MIMQALSQVIVISPFLAKHAGKTGEIAPLTLPMLRAQSVGQQRADQWAGRHVGKRHAGGGRHGCRERGGRRRVTAVVAAARSNIPEMIIPSTILLEQQLHLISSSQNTQVLVV
jgi:hypothetical protein